MNQQAVLTELNQLTPLRLTGADRLDFLHGQTSNDVKGLKVGQGNTSLLLNVKGHALAQMQVYRREEDLFVVIEDGAGELVISQLQAHIIFDQVEIQDLSESITVWTLQGERSKSVMKAVLDVEELPEGSYAHTTWGDHKILLAPHARTAEGGFDLHVLRQDSQNLRDKLLAAGARQGSQEELEQARILAAIPKAASEAGEGILPQEAALDFAVSYHKGCYLGQEIMARIEARGNVRRQLVRLIMEQAPSIKEISQQNKVVGRLGSVVKHPNNGYVGLAVVRKDLEGDILNLGDVQAKIDKPG